jgi:hypothetical protein
VLITVLAWVITVGILTAIPLALCRSQSFGWALLWSVTALFGVQEMWIAEHRFALLVAWILTAIPVALCRSQSFGWALLWSVTALFGVQEMWIAEHRFALLVAWEAAFQRNAELLQQCQKSQRQQSPGESTSESHHAYAGLIDSPFRLGLFPSETPPNPSVFDHDRLVSDGFPRNSRNKTAVVSEIDAKDSQTWYYSGIRPNWLNQPQTPISADLDSNYQNQAGPTPFDFI